VKTKPKSLACIILLTCAVTSCTSTPKEQLDLPEYAFNSNSRYAVLWIKPCNKSLLGRCDADDGRSTEAKFIVHGSIGQVDLEQEYEDNTALSASIARINASGSVQSQYLQAFKQEFTNRGMNAVSVANGVHEGALEKVSSRRVSFDNAPLATATRFPLQLQANNFDFSSLYDQLDTDFLVVMELLRFSVEQHYGPTGQPAGNPQIVSALRLYVHERATKQILFDDYAYHLELADDDWDKPPLYESLEASLMNTLEQSINDAKANLFR